MQPARMPRYSCPARHAMPYRVPPRVHALPHCFAGLNVSCMAWNKANRDLLAVGYGSHDFSANGSGRRDGVIALWSISNPEYPQAVLRTPGDVGVTAIDFSTSHPSMLAAGLSNGIICVYDVKRVCTHHSHAAHAHYVHSVMKCAYPTSSLHQVSMAGRWRPVPFCPCLL